MKTILTIHEQDIAPSPEAPIVDAPNFRKREAVRAVVSDSDGKIALLHAGLYDCHKLPGGGIEEGEDLPTALERELLEEIGCEVEVTGEVGKVLEYREQSRFQQISYCFVATQIGEKASQTSQRKNYKNNFQLSGQTTLTILYR